MTPIDRMSSRHATLLLVLAFGIALIAYFGLLREGGFFGGASANPGPNLERGLVGYWKFDDEGTAVIDSSGYGNDGVFVNSGLAPGRSGQALSLTGKDDSHASIPATDSLAKFTDQITVSAWVYPNGRPDGFIVVASRQVGTLQHPDQFYLGYGPTFGFVLYKWHLGTDDGGQQRDGSIYAGLPGANRWIHIAGTYDGTMMRLYVDGRVIRRVPLSGLIQVDDNPLTVGGEENTDVPQVVDGEFHGLVDELRIYNRALTTEEIRILAGREPR